jgi:hypothetical protein
MVGVRKVVFLLASMALAVLLASGVVLLQAPSRPAHAASDLLPDLGMARLVNLQIENTADGRKLLRFDSIVVNVGDGAFEVRGRRPDTTSQMRVRQRIYDDAGGYRHVATTAQMYFAGDGHTHWHLRDLEEYALERLDNGALVGTGAKHGFCFYDNYRFGSDQARDYRGCGKNPDALSVKMGLSRGWGDLYRAHLPDQYIDITELVSGSYRLRATADAANWFLETDDTNNFTWVDIQISGNSVSVKEYGPAAQPI